MALQGIDVASWDAGIDVTEVPCDFVIVKATGGTRYDNPDFQRVADDALAAGKLLGIYHFAGDGSDGSPEEEAAHFLTVTDKYKGKFIPVLDWEADAVEWPVHWAKRWLEIVEERTGATPWFYSYASYVGNHDCSEIAEYPLWIAAYYKGYESMGYQDDPPLYGSKGDFEDLVAYQYTSSGDLPNWGGDLDLSIFYGDRGDWMSFVNGDGSSGGGDIYGTGDDEVMQFLYQPDDKPEMRYHDGTKNIRLSHPDQMQVIIDNYKRATGKDIAIFKLGNGNGAPWAKRFEQCFPLVVADCNNWED